MGDTKAHPIAQDSPTKNSFFEPESGPAIEELNKKRMTPGGWSEKGGAGKPEESR